MFRPVVALALAALALAALAASAGAQADGLPSRVESTLSTRGLGRDGLRVVANVLENEYPAPRATPAVVLDLLRHPLLAADAASIFARSVPPELLALADPGVATSAPDFDALLDRYIGELAEAQAELMGAVAPFDEAGLVRALASGMPLEPLAAIERAVDAERLARARTLFVGATARFVRELRAPGMVIPPPQRFDSAIGLVVIGTRGADHHLAGAALIIDPDGDDVYERAPAMNGAISIVIDLGGNDRYRGSDIAVHALSALVDLAGSDSYAADGPGLGAAIAGVSVLVDLAGDDDYQCTIFGEGAGVFGLGALLDRRGNDRYRAHAFAQGYGGSGGIGVLWDATGDDVYLAAGLPDAYQRGGGLSFAQGAAAGVRDALGGGVGILRDDAGDDRYEAQMFAQGTGYYFSLGLLWDGAGADQYLAVRYAQGNGVHQAVGALRDDLGDDRYALSGGVGQGMGLDTAVGVLVDASGNDRYRSDYIAQGSATANGFGLLADEAGDNEWQMGADPRSWGHAQWYDRLPTVGVLLYDPAHARFVRSGQLSAPVAPRVEAEPEPAPDCSDHALIERLVTDPVNATAEHGELLPCALAAATSEQTARFWDAFDVALSSPGAPFLRPIAFALREHPGPPALMQKLQDVLRAHPRCTVRAFWMASWATADEARDALGAGCWRLQAAAAARLKALGIPAERAPSTADFLRLD